MLCEEFHNAAAGSIKRNTRTWHSRWHERNQLRDFIPKFSLLFLRFGG